MIRKSIKVVFDANVWISFLIGAKLQTIINYLTDDFITIVVSD